MEYSSIHMHTIVHSYKNGLLFRTLGQWYPRRERFLFYPTYLYNNERDNFKLFKTLQNWIWRICQNPLVPKDYELNSIQYQYLHLSWADCKHPGTTLVPQPLHRLPYQSTNI